MYLSSEAIAIPKKNREKQRQKQATKVLGWCSVYTCLSLFPQAEPGLAAAGVLNSWKWK